MAPLGVVISSLCDELKLHHVERLSDGICGLEEGTVFTDILNCFNRIATHCASTMVALMQSGDAFREVHIHNSKVHPTDTKEYHLYFKEYNQKYDLKTVGKILSMEPEDVE